MAKRILWLAVTCRLLSPAIATADTVTFYFAPLGNAYSAAMFADDPLVGKQITAARVYLEVESFAGSDAANFFTDIVLPIDPFPGNSSVLVLAGSNLNWSGAGLFSHLEQTTRFNGTFVARRYGAETPGEDFLGVMSDGRIELDVPDYVRGDFDDDANLTQADIDWLADEIIVGNYARAFDLNFDGRVDLTDHYTWVKELRRTWFGDADLNGEFDSSDLITVLAAGQYEDTVELNSTWSTGDWNADGDFNSADLVWALTDGGYEQGPRVAGAAVPEPTGVVALTISGLLIGRTVRRRRCRRVTSEVRFKNTSAARAVSHEPTLGAET